MWYIATSASVVSGQDVVEVLAGDDVSSISSGSALIFEDGTPVEVLEAYETTGGSFIKLASNWPYTTKTAQPLLVYPTSSGLAEATAALKLYLDNIQVASTVEAQAGTNDTKIMTALKTKQAIDFNTGTAAAADVTTSNTDATAGRLLKVGDFGISGNVSPPFSNTLNYDSNEVTSGVHRITSTSQITLPADISSFGVLEVSRYGEPDLVQVYTPILQDKMLFRRIRGEVVSDWQEVYHSGNSVNPLDYGVGGNAILLEDFDSITATGLYRNSSGSAIGLPKQGAVYTLLHTNVGEGRASQIAIENFPNSLDRDMYFRTKESGSWTEWNKVYHSGNTNFNKIIGDVAGRQLGEVTIRNATTASFCKDISSFTSRPSSVTATGTYRIVTRNGASVITGIQASDITLESVTSNARLNLRISNIDTSAMSTGSYYELASDVDNTLIEINP